jgi:hypothetical protein
VLVQDELSLATTAREVDVGHARADGDAQVGAGQGVSGATTESPTLAAEAAVDRRSHCRDADDLLSGLASWCEAKV